VFLAKVEELAPEVLKDLRGEVLPAFPRWHPPGGPLGKGNLLAVNLQDLDRRVENAEKVIGATGTTSARTSVLDRLEAIREIRDPLLRWCERYNLPPKPADVFAKSSGRRRERWIFEAVGRTLDRWVRHPDASSFASPSFGVSLPSLPPPPLEGLRQWEPLTEPWEADGRGARARRGYLPYARETAGLSHRTARELLAPYRATCEALLRERGYLRVPEKRASGGGRPTQDYEDLIRPDHGPAEHFAWFVAFQVLRKDPRELVWEQFSAGPGDRIPVGERTVQSAIRELATLLPLQLRNP
jgi:hypothetical protein